MGIQSLNNDYHRRKYPIENSNKLIKQLEIHLEKQGLKL